MSRTPHWREKNFFFFNLENEERRGKRQQQQTQLRTKDLPIKRIRVRTAQCRGHNAALYSHFLMMEFSLCAVFWYDSPVDMRLTDKNILFDM